MFCRVINSFVHRNLSRDAPEIMVAAGRFLFDYYQKAKLAIEEKLNAEIASPVVWQPPGKGQLKLNVDATVFHKVGRVGVGALVSDDGMGLLYSVDG